MATMSVRDTVRVPPRIAFRRVGDEMALVNLDTGVYYGLDAVGARMWELLAGDGRLHTVAARMQEEFDVAPDQLEADLIRLVSELLGKGLVERSGEGAP